MRKVKETNRAVDNRKAESDEGVNASGEEAVGKDLNYHAALFNLCN